MRFFKNGQCRVCRKWDLCWEIKKNNISWISWQVYYRLLCHDKSRLFYNKWLTNAATQLLIINSKQAYLSLKMDKHLAVWNCHSAPSWPHRHNLREVVTSAVGWVLGCTADADASLSWRGIWTWYSDFFWTLAELGRDVALRSPYKKNKIKKFQMLVINKGESMIHLIFPRGNKWSLKWECIPWVVF